MKEITLYNHFHNGDVFYSRVIIQLLSKHYKINYYHRNPGKLFEDLTEINEVNSTNIDEMFLPQVNKIDLGQINTWIGQDNLKYVLQHNCSFRSNMILLKDITDVLKIEIGNEEDLLPVVRYQNLKNIDIVTQHMNGLCDKYKKIIFVSNGNVQSSQSLNFNFSQIINILSESHKDYCFITMEDTGINKENVINSNNITQTIPDLLLLSYISTRSDVIIGRASGPYCFGHVKENLLNSNKTFISFSRTSEDGTWYDNSIAKQVWSNNYNFINIINTINENI